MSMQRTGDEGGHDSDAAIPTSGRRRDRTIRLSALGAVVLLLVVAALVMLRRDEATVYVSQDGLASSAAIRPTEFRIRGLQMRVASWGTWSGSEASGTGEVEINTCKPSCADANYETYQASFELSDPVDRCGRRFFSVLTWNAADGSSRSGRTDVMAPTVTGPGGEPC